VANLLQRLTGRGPEERSISTIDDYIAAVGSLHGYGAIQQTMTDKRISVGQSFSALSGAMGADSVVFTCMEIRRSVFSSARFRWQRVRDGKPADMFGTSDLRLLETPWPGGTTQDLLSRAIQDADLAGNAFHIRDAGEIVRLRPDWVDIVVEERRIGGALVGWRKLGFVYYEGGKHSGNDGAAFTATEVSHFMPIPDPLNPFRGMSWLTPVVREIEADLTMTRHKRKFFENGATPNMIITHPQGATREKILDFQKRLDAESTGTDNAYRTLNLYPGADATVVGADLRSIDFKAVQGAGETRIASASGVGAVIAQLSEGMQGSSLNAGNYGQARRRFADATMHPLWQNAAGSFAPLLASPGAGVRLWYDADNIPFLREDEADAADIAQTRATTIRSLIDAGYEPGSVVAAVEADDFRLLTHTGLFSVQLQKPGSPNSGQPSTEGEQP
jgi:Phage-related protein